MQKWYQSYKEHILEAKCWTGRKEGQSKYVHVEGKH